MIFVLVSENGICDKVMCIVCDNGMVMEHKKRRFFFVASIQRFNFATKR